MKKHCIFLALGFAAGWFTNVAEAFSIEAVTVSPGNYVAPFVQVNLLVDIVTPSQPTYIYAPSQVSTNANGVIHVDVFPMSGTLTTIGSLRETVTLGTFPVGNHQYEVVIHPGYEVNWGTRTNTGAFAVIQPVPTVSLTATNWRTSEPCPTCPAAASTLTITRTEPTNAALTVYLDIDGTATPDEDYRSLPSSVEIPAGEFSTQIAVEPLDDDLAEGPEIVRVKLRLSSNYWIDPAHPEKLLVIFDNEPDAPPARLDIIAPTNGTHFFLGSTVQLSAMAVYTNSEVYGPVEFYANDELIATSKVTASTRPPVQGLPSVHTASWTNAPLGEYTLTARTRLSFSLWVTSAPVNISVEAPSWMPIVSLESSPPENAHTPELCTPNVACPPAAGFVVRRTGATNDELNVYLSYAGTATPDVDYYALSGRVTIPAGADSIFVPVVPKDDDLAEGPETVIASFLMVPAPLYMEDPFHWSAVVVIDDDEVPEPPIVTVTATDCFAVEPPTYRPLDTASFRISRSGPTNSALDVSYTMEGSAENGIDYETLSGRAVIPSGSSSIDITIWPLPDDLVEGTETIILRLVPQPQYQLPPRGYAVAVISDSSWRNPTNGVRYADIGNGCLHICWTAATGQTFEVEASSDLRSWESVLEAAAADGAVHFVEDQMTAFPHRFYRLAAKPTVFR